MEYPHLNNIIDKDKFESFTTSEKIKFCLDKGILEIQTSFNNNILCVDYNSLDLLEFNKLDFDITKGFQIKNTKTIDNLINIIRAKTDIENLNIKKGFDKIFIKETVLFYNEVYNGISEAISFSSIVENFENKIIFELNSIDKKKKKIKYLQSKIKEIDPFNISEIIIDFNFHSNELYVHHDTQYYLMESASKFKLDWINGKHMPGSMFIWSYYPCLHTFHDGFSKLLNVNFCYRIIQFLKEETEHIDKVLIEKSIFTPNQIVILLASNEMNVIHNMEKLGLSNTKMAMLISDLTGKSKQNIREKLGLLNKPPSKLNSKYEDDIKYINEYLNNLKK